MSSGVLSVSIRFGGIRPRWSVARLFIVKSRYALFACSGVRWRMAAES
jgi:hypothetical protein